MRLLRQSEDYLLLSSQVKSNALSVTDSQPQGGQYSGACTIQLLNIINNFLLCYCCGTLQEKVQQDLKLLMCLQGCLFTTNVNTAIRISDAMETGTVQVNAAPSRGPDHFPFQGFRDSGIGSQGIINSLAMMVRDKSTVINLDKPSYTMG